MTTHQSSSALSVSRLSAISFVEIALMLAAFAALIPFGPGAVGLGAVVVGLSMILGRGRIARSRIRASLPLLMYATVALAAYGAYGASPSHYAAYVGIPVFFFIVGNGLVAPRPLPLLLGLLFFFFILALSFTFRDVDGRITLSIANLRILQRGQEVLQLRDTSDSFFLQNNTSASIYYLTPLAICLVLFQRRARALYLVGAGVLGILIFLLNTRSAYLALLCMLGVFALAQRKNPLKAGLMLTVFGVFLAVGISLFLESYGSLFSKQAERLTMAAVEDALERRAELYWLVAINHVIDNPLGHGHRFFFDRYEASTHNEIIGQMVAVGLAGAAVYYAFIGHALVTAFKTMRMEDPDLRAMGALVVFLLIIYLVVGLTEQVTVSGRVWISYVLAVIGVFYAQVHRERPTD